jgi:ribonuclease HI
MLPTHDALGNPFVHMASDGACTSNGDGGCAWFDGVNYHKLKCKVKSTNNKEEYKGLIYLLQTLITTKFDGRALIMMDSQLVVNQMNGSYSVKNEGLKPLYAKAASLASLLDVEIIWVPRTHPIMGKVDKLAKEAAR